MEDASLRIGDDEFPVNNETLAHLLKLAEQDELLRPLRHVLDTGEPLPPTCYAPLLEHLHGLGVEHGELGVIAAALRGHAGGE